MRVFGSCWYQNSTRVTSMLAQYTITPSVTAVANIRDVFNSSFSSPALTMINVTRPLYRQIEEQINIPIQISRMIRMKGRGISYHAPFPVGHANDDGSLNPFSRFRLG